MDFHLWRWLVTWSGHAIKRRFLLLKFPRKWGPSMLCKAMWGSTSFDQEAGRARRNLRPDLYWGFHEKGKAGRCKQFTVGSSEQYGQCLVHGDCLWLSGIWPYFGSGHGGVLAWCVELWWDGWGHGLWVGWFACEKLPLTPWLVLAAESLSQSARPQMSEHQKYRKHDTVDPLMLNRHGFSSHLDNWNY